MRVTFSRDNQGNARISSSDSVWLGSLDYLFAKPSFRSVLATEMQRPKWAIWHDYPAVIFDGFEVSIGESYDHIERLGDYSSVTLDQFTAVIADFDAFVSSSDGQDSVEVTRSYVPEVGWRGGMVANLFMNIGVSASELASKLGLDFVEEESRSLSGPVGRRLVADLAGGFVLRLIEGDEVDALWPVGLPSTVQLQILGGSDSNFLDLWPEFGADLLRATPDGFGVGWLLRKWKVTWAPGLVYVDQEFRDSESAHTLLAAWRDNYDVQDHHKTAFPWFRYESDPDALMDEQSFAAIARKLVEAPGTPDYWVMTMLEAWRRAPEQMKTSGWLQGDWHRTQIDEWAHAAFHYDEVEFLEELNRRVDIMDDAFRAATEPVSAEFLNQWPSRTWFQIPAYWWYRRRPFGTELRVDPEQDQREIRAAKKLPQYYATPANLARNENGQPERLIATARQLGGSPENLVAIELETFFDQNQAAASIAPNLIDHPGPQAIYEALRKIRDRPDVSSVQVLVRLEFDQYSDGEWPFGEVVQAVTSAPLAEIDALAVSLMSDRVTEDGWQPAAENPAEVPEGQRVVTIWWY